MNTTTSDNRLERLTRQLRITQGVLAATLVFIGLRFFGIGPAPKTLRAGEKVAVGPNAELTMSVGEDSSWISYGREGDPSGYDLWCSGDRCQLDLRVHRDHVYGAQLDASEGGGLTVHARKGKGDSKTMEVLEISPAMGLRTNSSEGSVFLDPTRLMLMEGDNNARLEVGEDPVLTLSGTSGLRSHRSTDPKPKRDDPPETGE